MSEPRKVVYVCLHGSAKSVIAAAHTRVVANRLGIAASATALGVEPDAHIPPAVVAGLRADGVDVSGQRPRGVTPQALAGTWRIVTFGCDVGASAPAGVPVERWDDVPAVSASFETARDAIRSRVERLLTEMGGRP